MRNDMSPWTPTKLLEFEEDIAQEFAAGKIHAPIHLSGGNEKQLIEIFDQVNSWDWVLCAWRSHYHCLLKGVPPKEVKKAIMEGKSVSLCFPEYKILCSGIVGGIAPIATGLAWSCRQHNMDQYSGYDDHVHVFVGDMTAETGIVTESMKYAAGHKLPITWHIEDNGISVMTNTKEVWGNSWTRIYSRRYHFKLTRPHSGIGKWVRF